MSDTTANSDHPAGSNLPGRDDAPTDTDIADDAAYSALAAAVLDDAPPADAPPALVVEIDRILGGIDPSRTLISAAEVFDWLLDLRGIAADQN